MNRTYVSHSVVPYLPTSLRIRFISNGGENDHKPNPQANKKEKYPEVHEWVSETAYANLQTIRKSYEKLEPFSYHTLYYSILYIILYYIIHYKYYKYYIIYYATLSFMNYYQLSHYPQRNKMWNLWRRVPPHSHLSSNMICQIRKLNGTC